MNLDEQIERIYRSAEGTGNAIHLTKQLIIEVLNYVEPNDASFDAYEEWKGYQRAISRMKAKRKVLGL